MRWNDACEERKLLWNANFVCFVYEHTNRLIADRFSSHPAHTHGFDIQIRRWSFLVTCTQHTNINGDRLHANADEEWINERRNYCFASFLFLPSLPNTVNEDRFRGISHIFFSWRWFTFICVCLSVSLLSMLKTLYTSLRLDLCRRSFRLWFRGSPSTWVCASHSQWANVFHWVQMKRWSSGRFYFTKWFNVIISSTIFILYFFFLLLLRHRSVRSKRKIFYFVVDFRSCRNNNVEYSNGIET